MMNRGKKHWIVIPHTISTVEEGLMLGNGDISLVCTQLLPGRIVFQLGKSDLWDRRIDCSRNPAPAHIEELRDCLETPGFRCDGVTGEITGEISERLRTLCQPVPSMMNSGPMPKPGIRFELHYPADWPDSSLRQTLRIEEGMLELLLYSRKTLLLRLQTVVHANVNRLSIHWKRYRKNFRNTYGGKFFGLPERDEIGGTLYRPREQSLKEFRKREFIHSGNRFFDEMTAQSPLPSAVVADGILRQEYPEGPSLYATLCCSGGRSVKNDYALCMESELCEGNFFIGLSTESACDARSLVESGNWNADRKTVRQSSEKFFRQSAVSFADPVLERCWYAAMHAKRCVLRAGKIPPGLFFPALLRDYSMWHGDYHLNYNFQSIFLGDWVCNHTDTGDAFFDGLSPLMKLGEKISRDYYHIPGGCFIQLSGFPFETQDDYFGGLPLGRMAYMTGWTAAWFYRRWRLTRDREFLVKRGYPALKKFAIFYTGFLTQGKDGFYHAYPSNEGESEFSRAGCYDQLQVLHHACYTLRATAEAATELGVDAEAAAHWRVIADKLPKCELLATGIEPEFATFDGQVVSTEDPPDFLTPGNRFYDWYSGQTPYKLSILLRNRRWNPARFHRSLIEYLQRWELPNGLLRAMATATHGVERGGWTESLGIAGALTDMLMISVGGVIRLFPGIPGRKKAAFSSLRAEGAFLVSSEKMAEDVKYLEIYSEFGGYCRIVNPWKTGKVLLKQTNRETVLTEEKQKLLVFDTLPGRLYHLSPEKSKKMRLRRDRE